MRVMNFYKHSTSNGEGLRNVVFFSGCNKFCNGCHNHSSWSLLNGEEMFIDEVVSNLVTDKFAEITISGGDALVYQYKELLELLKVLKSHDKNIWLFTGYTFEELVNEKNEYRKECLNYIDVLVDGRYIDEQRDLTLKFRGSKNQRIISVQQSLKQNKLILWEE